METKLTLVKRDEQTQTYRDEEEVNEVISVTYSIKENDVVVGEANANTSGLNVNMYGLGNRKVSEYDAMLQQMFSKLNV